MSTVEMSGDRGDLKRWHKLMGILEAIKKALKAASNKQLKRPFHVSGESFDL